MTEIARKELGFPVLLALLMIIAGTLPYLYGYWSAKDNEVYLGFVGNGTIGANGYLMLARQAQQGEILFENRMTPEPTRPAYFDLEWLLFGRMARHTGLSLMTVFHIWRVITVLGFMFATYYLSAQCFESISSRRLALLLLVFGSGFGWLVWLVNRLPFLELPLSLDMKGVTLFGYLINKPHFIRAALFLLLQCAFLIRGETTGKWRYFILSGLAATGLVFIRFHHIPESYMLFLGLPALFCFLSGTIDIKRILQYGVSCLVLTPATLYAAYSLYTNAMAVKPAYWPGPLFGGQVLWLGLPFLLCCTHLLFFGLTRLPAAPKPTVILGFWLFGAWMIAAFHQVINSGHEIAGLALMTVPAYLVLAGPWPALLQFLKNTCAVQSPRLCHAFSSKWITVALIMACMPSSGYVYARMFKDLHNPVPPELYYLEKGTYKALEWLTTQGASNDVVLASYATSQYIAGQTNKKVVAGHDLLTRNDAENHGLIFRFYQHRGEDDFKRYVIDRFRVRYVLFGPLEHTYNGFDPAEHSWLQEVFRSGQTTIYKVVDAV